MRNYNFNSTLGCAFLLSLAFAAQAQQKRPNVIVIYTDDQGSLDMNCYGAKDLCTPNMDGLAQQGVRFTQFYGAPLCSVSRASLLTGQFAKRAGLTGNAGGNKFLFSEKVTIAEKMKANGYSTALIGKWHLGDKTEVAPNAQGFDYFFGFRGGCIDNYSQFFYWAGPNKHDLWRNENEVHYDGQYFPQLTVREIRNYVLEHKEKPFFLYWAINMPHYPLQGYEKWLDYYKNLKYPRNLYAAYISTLDELVGEVVTFIDKQGLRDNTIIIFQSDNGHSVEERTHFGGGYCGQYRGAKGCMFEGGIRLPAIISWPGHLPQGEVRDQMAMNIDWFPTIAELCDIDMTDLPIDGKSLLPVIKSATAKTPHDYLHFDLSNQWALIKGDWKLINMPTDPTMKNGEKLKDKIFLSNLKMSISESENFAEKYPDVVNELQKIREDYENELNK